MSIIQFPTPDNVKAIISESRDIICNARELSRNDRPIVQRIADSFQSWATESNAARLQYEQQQQTMQMQQQFYQMSNTLSNMFAYALNCMPRHFDFWGNLTSHSIHVAYRHNQWTFPLPHSQDAHDMPQHFYQTAAELQQILVSIRQSALNNLTEEIRMATDILSTQCLSCQFYDAFQRKDIQEFWTDYRVAYTAQQAYLFRISALTMIPTSEGVNVSFIAEYDDNGMHPANYWHYLCYLTCE